jgi:CRP-like cAMP-binding protein
MKAIGKDPGARYTSWLDFGKDLSQAFMSLRLADGPVTDSEKFNRLREFQFFEDFNDVALWEVVRIGSWKTIVGASVVIREGEVADSFYFLAEGEVDVSLSGKSLATVRPGGCFGEILYFTGLIQRRSTTITTRSEVTVIEIKANAMRAATDGCQVAFNKACMRVLIERLAQSNQRIAQAA